MKRIAAFVLALCLLAGLLSGCGGKKPRFDPDVETVVFTDSAGRKVEVPANVTRVAPSGAVAEVNGGAAGYFSLTGDMDFAIVIRTLVKEGARVTMRSGAGIVADSVPEREYDETIGKAKAVFEAVKFAEELR